MRVDCEYRFIFLHLLLFILLHIIIIRNPLSLLTLHRRGSSSLPSPQSLTLSHKKSITMQALLSHCHWSSAHSRPGTLHTTPATYGENIQEINIMKIYDSVIILLNFLAKYEVKLGVVCTIFRKVTVSSIERREWMSNHHLLSTLCDFVTNLFLVEHRLLLPSLYILYCQMQPPSSIGYDRRLRNDIG